MSAEFCFLNDVCDEMMRRGREEGGETERAQESGTRNRSLCFERISGKEDIKVNIMMLTASEDEWLEKV